MYYVVTGAAGFIGSNLVKALNERGENNIIAVDNLKNADKFKNLTDCEIADYMDKEEFIGQLNDGYFDGLLAAVLHEGACSDTMETNGRYMMQNNYRYSLDLLNYCQEEEIPFLYASSASVYGGGGDQHSACRAGRGRVDPGRDPETATAALHSFPATTRGQVPELHPGRHGSDA